MSKDVAVANQHQKLITDALPRAIDVLIETMSLDPNEDLLDEKGAVIGKKLNLRISSQRLKAAVATVSVVERLGDQALKRKAGSQIKHLLDEIREIKKRQKLKTIDAETGPRPSTPPVEPEDLPEDP